MATANRQPPDARGEERCLKCGKLLARDDLKQNALEIKCVRCGTLNSVFRGIKDQVIITDTRGTILYANSLVETVTGYTLAEIIGSKPSLWGGQMSQEFYRKMWRVIKVKKLPIAVEVVNRKKDGTLYKVTLRISPIFNARGQVKMFVGMETVI
jgi:PAS domain S-box-containing protein